jgi:hypothetical protein
MEYKDLFLGPIYLLLIYFIAFSIRNKVNKSVRSYFIPALTLKLFGAVALGLIYQFYYKGGDTFSYFTYGSSYIWKAFLAKPSAGLWLIFAPNCNFDHEYSQYAVNMLYYCDTSSYFVIRISGFLGLLSFHTYIVNAMFFALISFIGVWKMFITFTQIYPSLKKQLVMACFLLPSVIFWGSGLMKDSITFGCLGLFFSSFYRIFIEKKTTKGIIAVFICSFFVIKVIKIYIILCFIPAAALWLFMVYNEKIKSKMTRILIRPIMILIGCVFGFFSADYISKEDEKYSMANLTKTAETTSYWLSQVSRMEKGSGYSLGQVEFTPLGMTKKIPAAINVTLFRPYLWESKNIVMLLSAFESLFILYMTVSTLFKVGIKRAIKIISEQPIVAASLVFSLTFSFAVGLSTSNFGTLVRYKIPMMPFYLISVLVVRYYGSGKKMNVTL